MTTTPQAIEVESLVKRFGSLRAVDDVSFSVRQGEVFALLGPNGAGKTTTINILCTLLRPTAGRARVAGWEVTQHPNQVRHAIGLVFQDPSLDDRLTAQENLEFHGFIYNVPRAEARRRIQELLEMVELWERRNDLVRTFSGGMRRRLELARGLLHRPQVLFLDEPTLGLDPQTRSHIWEYINQLRRQHEITVFLTTHYMDEADSNADRVAIMDQGKIIALDTPPNLKSLVGGDVVSLRVADNEAAASLIRQHYGLEVRQQDGLIKLEVAKGEQFIPELVRLLSGQIEAVDLHRPTLDDVFLKLIGRALREEEGTDKDRWRSMVRIRTRR